MTLREEAEGEEEKVEEEGGIAVEMIANPLAAAVAPTPKGFKGRATSHAAMAASNSKAAPMMPKASTFHSNNPLVKGLELKGRGRGGWGESSVSGSTGTATGTATPPPLSSITPPPSPPREFETLPGSLFKVNPMLRGRR